jgi:putative transposase
MGSTTSSRWSFTTTISGTRRTVSSATSYKWKAKYGGLDVSDAKRLKALEDENATLKRLLADAMLDKVGPKELLSKDGDTHRQARGRRSSPGEAGGDRAAGVYVGICRMTVRYRPQRQDDGETGVQQRERLDLVVEAKRQFAKGIDPSREKKERRMSTPEQPVRACPHKRNARRALKNRLLGDTPLRTSD